jgi:hypothetical protein
MDEQRIRLQTFAFDQSHELRPPSERVFYTVIFAGVFSLFIITYPYRDIFDPTVCWPRSGCWG